MRRDDPLAGLTHVLSGRRRRLRIGDLLAAVALVALGLATIAVPAVTRGERLLVSCLTAIYLGLVFTQWGLAGISFRRPRPMTNTLLGILSSLTALAAFVGVVVLGLLVPQAAALLSVTTLLLVVCMTTWE
jgi:hypothetical protein